MEEKQENIYEEILSELDEEDEKRIIVDYEVEKAEPAFRWEYAHEHLTEYGSIFRKIKSF